MKKIIAALFVLGLMISGMTFASVSANENENPYADVEPARPAI